MAVVGQPLVLRCLVVGLGKQPSKDVEVTFFEGETALGTRMTSAEGIAEFTLTPAIAGNQKYSAKGVPRSENNKPVLVPMNEQQLDVYVARAAVIHGKSTDYTYPVAGSGTPTLLWVTVREEANNQSRVIANSPIEWKVEKSGEFLTKVDISTDALGRSTFPFEADAKGDYVVTATLKSDPEQPQTFDLKVVPAIQWSYTLTDTGSNVVAATLPLQFIRGRTYRLEIDLPASVDLKDARAMLAWTGDFSAKGLGMIFKPATGAYVLIGDKQSLVWEIDCRDLRNGAFDLTFYCNRLDQRLVLPGRLDAPPPVVLYPAENDVIETQSWLAGIGSSSAQIYVFEGREGSLLARTSVGDDGKWSVRVSEPLSVGPHVISVKQRHIDTTEAWATDVRITVRDDYVGKVPIIRPVLIRNVAVNFKRSSWFEGVGLPGLEVRVVKTGDSTTIYAQGMVDKDGRWRIQLKPNVGVGTYNINAGFFQDGVLKSPWLYDGASNPFKLNVVD